MSRAERLT